LFSTSTTNRGSDQSRHRCATVTSSLMPFICMAPSPASTITGLAGSASLAEIPYGMPHPIDASVLDRWAGTPGGRVRKRAYQ
jgi:hypothetical protein